MNTKTKLAGALKKLKFIKFPNSRITLNRFTNVNSEIFYGLTSMYLTHCNVLVKKKRTQIYGRSVPKKKFNRDYIKVNYCSIN